MVNFTFRAPSGEAYSTLSPELLKQYRNSAPAKREPGVAYQSHDPDSSQPQPQQVPAAAPVYGYPQGPYSQVQYSQVYSPGPYPYSPQMAVPRSFIGTPVPVQAYAPMEAQSELTPLRRRNSSKSAKSSKSKSSRSTQNTPRRASTTPLSQADIDLYESPAVGKLISVLEESVALKKAEQARTRSSKTASVISTAPSVSSASSEATDKLKYEAEFLRRVQAKVALRNQKVKQAALLGERGIRLIPKTDPTDPKAGWGGYLTGWWGRKPDGTPAEPVDMSQTPTESLAAQYYQDLFQMMRDHDVPAVVGDAIVKGYEEAMRIEKEIKDETLRVIRAKEDAERKAMEKPLPPKVVTPAFLTVIFHNAEEERDFGYKIPVESIRTYDEFKKLMILTFPSKARHWKLDCFQVFDETNNYFIMGQFWDKLVKGDTILAVTLTPLPPEKEKEVKDKNKDLPAPVVVKKKKEPSKLSKAFTAEFDRKKFNQNTSKMFKKLVEASTRPV